jgi:hypothetical protein
MRPDVRRPRQRASLAECPGDEERFASIVSRGSREDLGARLRPHFIESGGLCEVAGARIERCEWRPHISRIERRRGWVSRYGESAGAVVVFEALFGLRGLAGKDRRAVRRRRSGDLGVLRRRGNEAVAAEAGRRGAAMARSVSAGGLAAWRWRAIEVGPRLDVMMCRSGRRWPSIRRHGRYAA